MIEGVRELNPAAPATVLPARQATASVHAAIPVILRATEAEAVGARMRVGGLRVVDRALRQLTRLRDARVVVAEDGTIPLPRALGPNVERRHLTGDVAAAIAGLKAELGPETASVGADTVWLQPGRFDKATRVLDRVSCRTANDAIYRDLERDPVGLVDRMFNQRISSRITRGLLAYLPLPPSLITLIAGFIGLYGALMVATGSGLTVVLGFVVLEGFVILDGCAGELARLRLRQTALAAWLDTVVGDFVNVVMVLAVGMSLWHHGGTYLDMKMALGAAGMTVFYMAVSYRELMRQGEGDVMKLRWWFAYGQTLRGVSGAGSQSIKAVVLLGRRDVIIFLAIGLAYFDQLPLVLLYALIIGIVRAAGALGQLLTPDWKTRPPT